MIEIRVTQERVKELALIQIEYLGYKEPDYRYMAKFIIDREGATGIHSRVFGMESLDGNVLNMLQAALNSLDEDAFKKEEIEDDGAGSQNLARGLD